MMTVTMISIIAYLLAATATECQRRSELSNHLLGVMHGFKQPPRQLSGSVHQLLTAASISRLEVPTCDVAGLYRYICTYRVSNLQLDGCRCTNSDGTYVGGARVKSCEDIGECGCTHTHTHIYIYIAYL